MHQISISWLRGIRIQRDIYSCYGHSGWQFDTHCLAYSLTPLSPIWVASHLFKLTPFICFRHSSDQFFTFLIFQLTHLQFTTLFLIYLVLGSTLQGLGFSCCLSLEWGCTCRRDVCALGNYLSLIEWHQINRNTIMSLTTRMGLEFQPGKARQQQDHFPLLSICSSFLFFFFL